MWQNLIDTETKKSYLADTLSYVAKRRAEGVCVYPAHEDVFNAFNITPFEKVRVVILGQDPYHGPQQAHGLCFSVLKGIKPPPSLVNIYKELAQDIDGFEIPAHGYLTHWANQGVLLLNTVLTVEQGAPNSHAHLGWESFTDKVIDTLNTEKEGIVFLLWGKHAERKGKMIDRSRHHVLLSAHPSPLSARRGFFGCQHFSKTNQYLIEKGEKPIDWCLPRE